MQALLDDFIDESAIVDADAVLRELAAAYPGYAAADLDDMQAALGALAAGQGPIDAGALFLPAHNLKGQGAAFGYDLVTAIGEALSDLVRDRTMFGASELRAIGALIDACRTVLREGLTGDGGPAGRKLMTGLGLHSP